jgi:hypothetical protein
MPTSNPNFARIWGAIIVPLLHSSLLFPNSIRPHTSNTSQKFPKKTTLVKWLPSHKFVSCTQPSENLKESTEMVEMDHYFQFSIE